MSDADTINAPPITVVAVAAPYGQAWRIDPEGAGGDIARSDLSRGIRSDGDLGNGEAGHVGTRLTLQADADARQTAREQASWARFMALANARNLELAARERDQIGQGEIGQDQLGQEKGR